jgi:hypothetical protein
MDIFSRLQASVYKTFGTTGLLNGAPVDAFLEEGVVMTGEFGEVISYRTIATVKAGAVIPAPGDSLVISGKSFIVDAIESNDGYFVACYLR